IASGPGVLVCDPVLVGTNSQTSAFGAGCGRWLHFALGAQPELGRTPTWASTSYTCLELKTRALRVSQKDVPLLAPSLGVTHFAIGTVEGTPEQCRLSYQL